MILLDGIGEDPAQLRTINRWQNSFCRAARVFQSGLVVSSQHASSSQYTGGRAQLHGEEKEVSDDAGCPVVFVTIGINTNET